MLRLETIHIKRHFYLAGVVGVRRVWGMLLARCKLWEANLAVSHLRTDTKAKRSCRSVQIAHPTSCSDWSPPSKVYNPLSAPAAPSSRTEVTAPPAAQHRLSLPFTSQPWRDLAAETTLTLSRSWQVQLWAGKSGDPRHRQRVQHWRVSCSRQGGGHPRSSCLVKPWAFEVCLSRPGCSHLEMPGSLLCASMWCPKISVQPWVIFFAVLIIFMAEEDPSVAGLEKYLLI